jgi:hypothetical protein
LLIGVSIIFELLTRGGGEEEVGGGLPTVESGETATALTSLTSCWAFDVRWGGGHSQYSYSSSVISTFVVEMMSSVSSGPGCSDFR